MKIFEKEKYIETKYKPIHIKRLNEEKIPYVIRERRKITSIARLVYFCYSVVLDVILVLGIIWATINIDKWWT